jgi:hypothetical protein
VFDAPEPWGPWTCVEYAQNWGGFDTTFFWCFAPKWLDGESFTLVFTGTAESDAWNTVRGRFILRSNAMPSPE